MIDDSRETLGQIWLRLQLIMSRIVIISNCQYGTALCLKIMYDIVLESNPNMKGNQ